MTIVPKITTEDVRLALNGTYSGSNETYWFWDQSVSSGSVLAQINLANYYMYSLLGRSKMDTSNEIESYLIKTAELDLSCFRLLVNLSGGVIVDGFSWEAGVKVENPKMFEVYKNLIQQFKDSAYTYLKNAQDIYVMDDGPEIDHTNTATSVM